MIATFVVARIFLHTHTHTQKVLHITGICFYYSIVKQVE